MASKTSKPDVEKWPGRRIDMAEYGRALAEHIAKNSPIAVPRNSGTRRTESKQALLDAINAITDKQGWRW
jgi:hypothetical protein